MLSSQTVSLQFCETNWEYFVWERKLEYLNTWQKHFVLLLLQTLNGIESPITYPGRPGETKRIQLHWNCKLLYIKIVQFLAFFVFFFYILHSNAECSFVYSISSLFPETSQFWFGFDFSLMQCQIVFSCISLVLLECSCWHYLVGATMDAPIILTRHLRATHYALSMAFSTMPCQWHSQCMECRKQWGQLRKQINN